VFSSANSLPVHQELCKVLFDVVARYAVLRILSAQQRLKTSLFKVVVVSQCGWQTFVFHDYEAGAIGETPAFVRHTLVSLEGSRKKLTRLRHN
jgi:hypothetical protein